MCAAEEYPTWFLRHTTKDHDAFHQATIDAYAETMTDQGGMRAGLDRYRAIPDMAVHLAPHADDLQGPRIADSGHFIPEALGEVLLTFLRRL